jgi:SAM-dependent methyltransferase
MDDALYQEMFEMEERHWWFTAKHVVVTSLLRRYLSRDAMANDGRKARICELGCGCGGLLSKLKSAFDVVGLDGAEEAVRFSAKRGLRIEQGFLPDQIPFERNSFDAVLILDVLEHLDEDAATARAAVELLKPGGILICTVPAYQWLWSKRDEHHHHRRRYSRTQFKDLFNHPQLKLELLSFYNTFLFPAAAAARIKSKVTRRDSQTDLNVPPGPINRALHGIFAFERNLLGRVAMPFGLSLIGVARRVPSAATIPAGQR